MSIILPLFLWTVVALVYLFRVQLNIILPGSYFLALFILPTILILFQFFPFQKLGLKIGKPLQGLFWMLLLPLVLFLRFYFMGKTFHLEGFPLAIVLGSCAEEFFFRGYLQEAFKKTLKPGGSFALTNLLFALLHLIKGYSLLDSLSAGLVGPYLIQSCHH